MSDDRLQAMYTRMIKRLVLKVRDTSSSALHLIKYRRYTCIFTIISKLANFAHPYLRVEVSLLTDTNKVSKILQMSLNVS